MTHRCISQVPAYFKSGALLFVCIAFTGTLTACSRVADSDGNETSSSETRELTPTAAGAVTGMAIGGGLGAIIGSTSGDAGAGLLIGGAAGAATGGLIGKQFEEQKRLRDEQTEKLRAQEETIDSQKRQIEELRGTPSDHRRAGISTKSSVGSQRARIQISSFNTSSRHGARTQTQLASARTIAPQPVRKTQLTPEPALPKSTNIEAAAPIAELPAAETVSTASMPQEVAVEADELPAAKSEVIETAELPALETEKLSEAADIKATIGSQAKMTAASTECGQAQEEADRAKRAVSDADRLFYYRRALKLCPSEPRYHLEIGQVYAAIGRKEDAKFEFRQVLDLEPGNVQANQELSLLETP